MCLRQVVREDENPRAYQGGNRGISFGGVEKGCYHQESLASVGEKPLEVVGKKEAERLKKEQEQRS